MTRALQSHLPQHRARRSTWIGVFALVAGLALFTAPGMADAAEKVTCVRVQVATNDSGFGITTGPDAGLTEDYEVGCGGATAGPCTLAAARTYVVVFRDGALPVAGGYTNSLGCLLWEDPDEQPSSTYAVWVETLAQNAEGLRIRVHNGSVSDFSSFPGETFKQVIGLSAPDAVAETVTVTGGGRPWVVFAMAMKTIQRWNWSIFNDNWVNIALDSGSNCFSSSLWGTSASRYSEGIGFVRVANLSGSCGRSDSQRKFLIAHEIGHVLYRLLWGANNGEPFASEVGFAALPPCGTGGANTYSMRSQEWNVIGFKEGLAHFVSTRSWNQRSASAHFRWLGVSFDAERYAFGAGASSGGRLKNECCSGSSCSWYLAGSGVNEDWHRFFWDIFTNKHATCTAQPGELDMLNLYWWLRANNALPGLSLSRSTYWEASRSAAQWAFGFSPCLATDRYDEYGAWNGVNTDL